MRTWSVPKAKVVFYKEKEQVYFLEWMKTVPAKAQTKCYLFLDRLKENGHELRRPMADLLRDGIYELRPSLQGIQYRILYFFSGKDFVVVSHGITKESAVPAVEIDRAIERKQKFELNPSKHTFGS